MHTGHGIEIVQTGNTRNTTHERKKVRVSPAPSPVPCVSRGAPGGGGAVVSTLVSRPTATPLCTVCALWLFFSFAFANIIVS